MALLTLFTIPVRADLFYFRNGGSIQARATVAEGVVELDTGFGRYRFPEKDFIRILPGFDPAAEFPARHERAVKEGASGLLSVAWWALENGLVERATQLIQEAHEVDPKDAQAAQLARLIERLSRPIPAPDTQALRAAIGTDFETRESAHLVLLHQHKSEKAAQRLAILERVVMAYYLTFAFQGVELPPPTTKLVSVYLRYKSDYLGFLERQNAGAFRTTQGYYHPTFRVVVAYDLAANAPVKPGNTSVRPTAQPPRRDAIATDDDRRRLLETAKLVAMDLGTACHETVHQLVRVSGLDGEPRRLPIWLHEGLAMQFEVIRGGRWAGVSRAHDLRMPDWNGLKSPPRLAPLVRDVPFGRGYDRDAYASAWALVYFLRTRHPAELITYIDLLRVPPDEPSPDSESAPPDPAAHFLDAFKTAFGPDLDTLQAAWLQYLATARPPLAEHTPTRR